MSNPHFLCGSCIIHCSILGAIWLDWSLLRRRLRHLRDKKLSSHPLSRNYGSKDLVNSDGQDLFIERIPATTDSSSFFCLLLSLFLLPFLLFSRSSS